MPTFGKHETRARNEKKESERLASRESYRGLAGEKARASKRAKRASFVSAKINARLVKKLVVELEQSIKNGARLTKKEEVIYSNIKARNNLDLKSQIKNGKTFKSQEVVQIFKILQRVDFTKAQSLQTTYQFRKLN